ncbi:type II restriction endonuclease [Hallella bergensis]|uniref:type II restriction endonuclease n=1 Tax=Hallella bergensis TaxID=242750 RepID=UPI0023F39A7C|nr:type II restriction endonuclease [Hallella bergensis]
MRELFYQIINDINESRCAFCRYITANDVGQTGSHQSGFYIPKEAARLLFEEPTTKGSNKDKYVEIKWQNDFITHSRFVYYGKKTRNEYRITRFGRNFPFFNDDNVGDLLILAQMEETNYVGYVLSADEEIDEFLSYFNLSPNSTNQLIDARCKTRPSERLQLLLRDFVQDCDDFPKTGRMAKVARELYNQAFHITAQQIEGYPDRYILEWLDAEYVLFQMIEEKVYASVLDKKFSSIQEFTQMANEVLNRRKSRAGKSLEHHLAYVFDRRHIIYESQVITEGRKQPDFIFPNSDCYHDFEFPSEYLTSLAAKTTCKDRWRQVISEADRIEEKHLFTLQQAISRNQLVEMKKAKVKLVVPHGNIMSFPQDCQGDLWDLTTFIGYLENKQEHAPRHFLMG